MRRNVNDADMMDVAYCAKEADYALQHLAAWMEPQRAPMPLVFEPGHIRVRRDLLGVTLIIGAWNEPFMLTFGPLTAALSRGEFRSAEAVGNRGVMRGGGGASGAQIFRSPRGRGGRGRRPETTALLEQKRDFIFFTGSLPVGKIVHQAAAKHPFGNGDHRNERVKVLTF